MAEPGIKLSQSKVTQTIDLNEVVGSDISDDEVLVTKIGQAIIDYMEERVDDGLGIGRVKLKVPYSPEYENSLEFIAAGKPKDKANMKLSGDMMGSIDLIKTDGSVITIGIDDPDQAPKAFNHQTGDTVPKRPFFGVTKKELKDYVLKEFKDEIAAKKVTSAEETNRLINFIRGIRTLGDLLE